MKWGWVVVRAYVCRCTGILQGLHEHFSSRPFLLFRGSCLAFRLPLSSLRHSSLRFRPCGLATTPLLPSVRHLHLCHVLRLCFLFVDNRLWVVFADDAVCFFLDRQWSSGGAVDELVGKSGKLWTVLSDVSTFLVVLFRKAFCSNTRK